MVVTFQVSQPRPLFPISRLGVVATLELHRSSKLIWKKKVKQVAREFHSKAQTISPDLALFAGLLHHLLALHGKLSRGGEHQHDRVGGQTRDRVVIPGVMGHQVTNSDC